MIPTLIEVLTEHRPVHDPHGHINGTIPGSLVRTWRDMQNKAHYICLSEAAIAAYSVALGLSE